MKKWKQTAGFTLVELIVVIAILGILAGVGTVGYSGYIKKANQAADNVLLSAVNQAFAAACLENGTDVHDIDSAYINLTDAKTVNSDSVDPEAYRSAFGRYFAGNETSAFKVFAALQFDRNEHIFKGTLSEAFRYGEGNVYIAPEDAEKLASSTFITAGSLGVNNLMNKVNDVANFAALLTNSDIMDRVFFSPDFQQYAAKAMGLTLTGDELTDLLMLDEKSTELAQQMVDSGKAANLDVAYQKVLSNAAIMYAANNAVKMERNDIVSLLSTRGTKDTIMSHLQGDAENGVQADPGKALTEAALAYGMYTAYAHTTNDDAKKNASILDVINDLDNPDFQRYMQENQGSIDLDGYLAALNMINNSADDTKAVSNVVINGFNDPDLIAVLNQALGQN